MITMNFTTDELAHLHNAMAAMVEKYCEELGNAAYKIDMSEEAYLAEDMPEIVKLTQRISNFHTKSYQNDKGTSDDNS